MKNDPEYIEWAKEHGEEFYRSVWPHGIPKEVLESFGIFVEPKESEKPPDRPALRTGSR